MLLPIPFSRFSLDVFLLSQYVTKINSELHQRAVPKRVPVLTIVEDGDDSIVRQVQRVPAIGLVVADLPPQPEDDTSEAVTQPAASPVKPTPGKTALQTKPAPRAVEDGKETPHVHVESEEAREARLDRQWKELKVDLAELPEVYARLAKIKLTGQ